MIDCAKRVVENTAKVAPASVMISLDAVKQIHQPRG